MFGGDTEHDMQEALPKEMLKDFFTHDCSKVFHLNLAEQTCKKKCFVCTSLQAAAMQMTRNPRRHLHGLHLAKKSSHAAISVSSV